MTKIEFLAEIAEILDADGEIAETTNLQQCGAFDSLAVMSLAALINSRFGIKIPGPRLKQIQTPAELISLIGEDAFEK